LYGARERFWNGIKHAMSYQATLSGYTTTLNAIDNQYPWKQSIESMLGFCDQVVLGVMRYRPLNHSSNNIRRLSSPWTCIRNPVPLSDARILP